jgi:histidinol-phosphate/aromatic aminotransferase/cobyric acid decarboxylase-like protein
MHEANMVSVDLGLFENSAHSPSFLKLTGDVDPVRAASMLTDFSVPTNPYFPTTEIFDLLRERLETILKFYPSENANISHDLALALDFDPDTLVVANGSTELITWIHELFIPNSLATDIPTFARWTDFPRSAYKKLYTFPRLAEHGFHIDIDEFIDFVRQTRAETLILCNPNNPTSQLSSREDVLHLIDSLSHLRLIVIDESFIDFAGRIDIPTIGKAAAERDNVILLKSLGKNFGMHGIRAGYAVANPKLTATLRERLPSWNINAITEFFIGIFPKYRQIYEQSRIDVIDDSIYLHESLRTLPVLEVFAPHSNFVYVELKNGDGKELRNQLLTRYGFLVRECGNKLGSSSQHFRIAARTKGDTDRLVEAIREVTAGIQPAPGRSAGKRLSPAGL